MAVALETNVRKNQKDIRTGNNDPYLLFQVNNYTPEIYDSTNWTEQKNLMNVDYQNQRVRNLDSGIYKFYSKHHVNQDLIFNPETRVAYNKGPNPYNVAKPNVPVKGTKLHFPNTILPNNNYSAFNKGQANFNLGVTEPLLRKKVDVNSPHNMLPFIENSPNPLKAIEMHSRMMSFSSQK